MRCGRRRSLRPFWFRRIIPSPSITRGIAPPVKWNKNVNARKPLAAQHKEEAGSQAPARGRKAALSYFEQETEEGTRNRESETEREREKRNVRTQSVQRVILSLCQESRKGRRAPRHPPNLSFSDAPRKSQKREEQPPFQAIYSRARLPPRASLQGRQLGKTFASARQSG